MRFFVGPLFAIVMATGSVHAADPVKPEQLTKLHALIKPQAEEERFMQIPWQTDRKSVV